jgi:hypothetical protein
MGLSPFALRGRRLDVVADDAAAVGQGRGQKVAQAVPNLRQLEQRSIEFHRFRTNQGQDVTARRTSGPAERQNLGDLGQGESQVPRLADEPEGVHRPPVIDPVAGGRSAGRRQQAFTLVAPNRPTTEPASLCQLANGHGRLPYGKPSR